MAVHVYCPKIGPSDNFHPLMALPALYLSTWGDILLFPLPSTSVLPLLSRQRTEKNIDKNLVPQRQIRSTTFNTILSLCRSADREREGGLAFQDRPVATVVLRGSQSILDIHYPLSQLFEFFWCSFFVNLIPFGDRKPYFGYPCYRTTELPM